MTPSSRSKPSRIVQVVAAVIVRGDGRYLLAQRPTGKVYAGYWEFPGGKIDADESPASALCRELDEELGIQVTVLQPFMAVHHDYPDRSVDLEFYLVDEWRGQPAGLEGQGLRWIAAAEIDRASLLPANLPVLDALQFRS